MTPDTRIGTQSGRESRTIRGELITIHQEQMVSELYPSARSIKVHADSLLAKAQYDERVLYKLTGLTRVLVTLAHSGLEKGKAHLTKLLPSRERRGVVTFRYVNQDLPSGIVAVDTAIECDLFGKNIYLTPIYLIGKFAALDPEQCLSGLKRFLYCPMKLTLQQQNTTAEKPRWIDIPGYSNIDLT